MADRGGTGAAWLPAAILGANLLQAALLGGLADRSGFGLPLQALAVLLSAGALFALSTVASARLAVLAPRGARLRDGLQRLGGLPRPGRRGGLRRGRHRVAGGCRAPASAGTLAALPAFWLASALRRPGTS